ncbi:MAG: GPR endopeptidase, partial [Clostridia bacterium]|nr:GPR endopeptidase [Clostridia bacterium]
TYVNTMNMKSIQNIRYPIVEARQDLGIQSHSFKQKGVDVSEVEIDKVASRKSGRKEGYYLTISPTPQIKSDTLADVIHTSIKKIIRKVDVKEGKILIVGLGNENVIVDALGNEVVKRIRTGGKKFNLSAIAPKVADITGIKSFDIVKAISEYHKPNVIIAIDTLATNYISRLGNCFQLTSAGICPGSGVDNAQPCLDSNSLPSPVIAIGVPLIISVGSIMGDKSDKFSRYMLTPRDVDTLVDNCADVIAAAINALGSENA